MAKTRKTPSSLSQPVKSDSSDLLLFALRPLQILMWPFGAVQFADVGDKIELRTVLRRHPLLVGRFLFSITIVVLSIASVEYQFRQKSSKSMVEDAVFLWMNFNFYIMAANFVTATTLQSKSHKKLHQNFSQVYEFLRKNGFGYPSKFELILPSLLYWFPALYNYFLDAYYVINNVAVGWESDSRPLHFYSFCSVLDWTLTQLLWYGAGSYLMLLGVMFYRIFSRLNSLPPEPRDSTSMEVWCEGFNLAIQALNYFSECTGTLLVLTVGEGLSWALLKIFEAISDPRSMAIRQLFLVAGRLLLITGSLAAVHSAVASVQIDKKRSRSPRYSFSSGMLEAVKVKQ